MAVAVFMPITKKKYLDNLHQMVISQIKQLSACTIDTRLGIYIFKGINSYLNKYRTIDKHLMTVVKQQTVVIQQKVVIQPTLFLTNLQCV